MACRVQDKTINDVLELLVAEGFEGMADAMSIMLNEAMRLDRSWHSGGAWRLNAKTDDVYSISFKKVAGFLEIEL